MSAGAAEGVVLRDLDASDAALVEQLHRDVLADAFLPDELVDAATIADGLRDRSDPHVLATVALGPRGRVVGGIVGEVYAPEHVLLLAYLAVRPDARGRGLGTALVRHAALSWFPDPRVRLAVAEVHDPRAWTGVAGEDPVARLRLFERLGARVLAVPFVQPALGPGRARGKGFLLLTLHVGAGIQAGAAVRSDILGRFVRRYYATSERVTEPYDPGLKRLLRAIEEQPTIELLPIADYERVPRHEEV